MNIFTKDFWIEKKLEIYISKILKIGVLLSCGITLFGGILYLFQHNTLLNYKTLPAEPFAGTSDYLRNLSTTLPRVFQLDGAAIIQLGIIVLIGTPIARVVFAGIVFLIEKDYMYVAISFIVLSIIFANMLFGIR